VGRFTLLSRIGEGSFGVVYQAHDPQLDRTVALKMTKSGSLGSPRNVARFLREARAAAQLRHPRIVPVYDAGRDGDHYYIASALIAGRTLEAVLHEGRPDFRRTAQIVRLLAEALAYAHGQGIVHRDVKPSNIMLDDQDQPLVMDFGLAAREEETAKLSQEGVFMGTPLYASPEQVAAHWDAVGPASDQYSLGVVLYQMLCGATPFSGSQEMVLLSQQEQEPFPPRRRDSQVPRDLETICLKTLAKKPAQRYSGCQELADDLGRWLAGEPIRARRIGPVEYSVKWARRNQAAAWLICVALVAVAAIVAALGLYAHHTSYLAAGYQAENRLRADLDGEMRKAQQQLADRQWAVAKATLSSMQGILNAREELGAARLRGEVARLLAEVENQLAREEQQRAAGQRLASFWRDYAEAYYYQTRLTGLNPDDTGKKFQEAARAALGHYHLEGDGPRASAWGLLLEQDRAHHSAEEHIRLVWGCYELLLCLAEAEAEPPVATGGSPVAGLATGGPPVATGQNQTEAQSRQRAGRALRLLDRAAQLAKVCNFDTRTYHRRKGLYEARVCGEKGEPPLPPEAPREPTGPIDWLMIALERYHADQFQAANEACQEVLRYDEGHFWARYLQGLCYLRAGEWVEAKAALTICLSRRPSFAWARVLRGCAAAELYRHDKSPGRLKEARADFDQALRSDRGMPVQYAGLVNRGVLFTCARDWPRAVADLEAAIKVKPSDYQAYVNLSQAYEGSEALDKARASLNQAIEQASSGARSAGGSPASFAGEPPALRAPTLAELYETRARLHLRLGQVAEAVADAQAAERNGPLTERLLYGVTCIYALAVTQLEQQGDGHSNRALAQQISLYEKKALELLERTLERVEPERRQAFWHKQVRTDPALQSIHRRPAYSLLDAKYGG